MKKQFNRMKQLANQTVGRLNVAWTLCVQCATIHISV
uniref:Rho GTPase activating protein 17 n=1 Tax=Mus musculus TaxID=10090 RepID=A0A0U1RPK6_MOUSE